MTQRNRHLPERYVLDAVRGIWVRPEFSGIAYSDGDQIEEKLAQVLDRTKDVSVLSSELRLECKDWVTLYHFSSERANLLRPFETQLHNAQVLEIGAGCGAITRYLGESGVQVLALEGSLRRASITRKRTRDLPNVQVVAEDFQAFDTEARFDVITLIGVLEYAALYTPGPDPALALLQKVKSFLKPDGKLIIAIENQLGLKYFAGSAEDHVGIPFYGVEGRYRRNQVRTFGRQELRKRILAAGFSQTRLLLPLPDYKLPVSIVSEEALANPAFDSAIFFAMNTANDPQKPRFPYFVQELVWPEIVRNGIAADMSNSFLFVAGNGDLAENSLAWHFSINGRKAKFAKTTSFTLAETGEITVNIEPVSGPAHPVDLGDFVYEPQAKAPYLAGATYDLPFASIVSAKVMQLDDVTSYFVTYFEHLKSIAHDINLLDEDALALPLPELRFPGVFLDALPRNIMIGQDGSPRFFDREWRSQDYLTPEYLLFRSLLSLLSRASVLGKPSCDSVRTHSDLIGYVLKSLGLEYDEHTVHALTTAEAHFYDQVLQAGNADPAWFQDHLSTVLAQPLQGRTSIAIALETTVSELDGKSFEPGNYQQANDLRKTVNAPWSEWYSSTILRRMVFHRSGKPRGWVRKLLLKDKSGTPRPAMRPLLFKRNGNIRPPFASWYAPYMTTFGEGSANYIKFLGSRIASGDLAAARTVHVITNPHTEFIGEGLTAALRNTHLTVTRSIEMPAAFESDLYIVVAPQMFANLPPPDKLIAVQVEQVSASRWVDQSYLNRLQNSLAVLDYSRQNIGALIKRGIPPKQIYYMPISPLRRERQLETKRDIDVLFYGAIGSDRRVQYINALAKRVNLRVESDTFGPALRNLLDRTKIVVNVHFYENAILETTRIAEALSHGAHVVSEDAVDQKYHTSYDENIDFVPRNEVETFVQRVEAALASWKAPVDLLHDDGFDGMHFHVLRALHGIGVLSLADMQAACRDMVLPCDRMILALPEEEQRYDAALLGRLPGAVPFHGLRQLLGWQGCAASYKFLATQALAQNLRRLTIYEDDALFDNDAEQRMTAIETYLDNRDDWDIFSGLLTDLHPDAQVTGLTTAVGEEFIELDSVIGMVFGVYSQHGLQMLANFEVEGNDANFHTIDRWLERRSPRTLTVLPPLARHNEHLKSTLWPGFNSHIQPMINDSINRLEDKRAAFSVQQKESYAKADG